MRPSLRPPWPKQSLLRWHPRAPQRTPCRIATTSSTNTAPVDIPRLKNQRPGSVHHNSLPTFLEYAKRTGLAPDKTVYVGTHYEYTAAAALMRLGFSLTRIGRRDDAGIDLIGHWALGPLPEPMNVIVQCKARKCSCTPSTMRELGGSFRGKSIPAEWRKRDVLGLLVTDRQLTPGVKDVMSRSRLPIGFVQITREGAIQQLCWNRAASDRGLEGVGVIVRHTPRILLSESERQSEDLHGLKRQGEIPAALRGKAKKQAEKFGNSGTDKDIQLTWMGTPIFPERESLDQRTIQLARNLNRGVNDLGTGTSAAASKRDRPRKPLKAPTSRAATTPRKRGRPKGSINAPEEAEKAPTRGRPKGSKNKPKVVVDVG